MDVSSEQFQIVVVDDDNCVLATNCELLARILPRIWPERPTPIPIRSANEAAAGLALIGQTRQGILITDIDLGGALNGFDLAVAAPHLPVIMITGALERHLSYIERLQRQRHQNAHCGLWYLGKPYRINELAEILRALNE